MNIPFFEYPRLWTDNRADLLSIIDKVSSTGGFILQEAVKEFEVGLANYTGSNYSVGVGNATDAMEIFLEAIGIEPSDEVIISSHTMLATASAIKVAGGIPVPVDIGSDNLISIQAIESAITANTVGIMPTQLNGRICDMESILSIAKKHGLFVVEDAAQCIGSLYHNKPSGSLGTIGCFSAHPLKNLNAIGDAGYLTTNNKNIFKKVIELRNHGMVDRNKVKNFGYVSRMDNLQAAVLNYRLKNFKDVIKKRRENFKLYNKYLNKKHIFISPEKKYQYNTYHTFVIQVDKRDQLKKYLKKNNIITTIHYAIPIHLQPAAKYLGYERGSFKNTEKQAKRILTLPINQFLKKKEIKYISDKINTFYTIDF